MHLKPTVGSNPPASLKVVLTIQSMEGPAGAALYVRDFAIELLRQGHRPVVYCRRLGMVDAQLMRLGIPVADSLDKLRAPDIIHGNSPIETVAVLLRFPDTPAIFVCHGWDSPDALAPRMPQIRRYLAVSEISRERLLHVDEIPEALIGIHQNPVDLARFPRRSALPPRPRRALVFNNDITEANDLPKLEEACARIAVSLDVVGAGMRKAHANPETILGDYDLVFARGRGALEALATGCAVILCDSGRLGELINTANYGTLRPGNLGRRTLQLPFEVETVLAQIARYDPCDAAAVTDQVRQHEGLCAATYSLVEIYRAAMDDFANAHVRNRAAERRAAARFLDRVAPTCNTFHVAEQAKPLEFRYRRAEARLRLLGTTLSMNKKLPTQELSRIKVKDPAAAKVVSAGEDLQASTRVENGTRHVLSSLGKFPVQLSYHWLNADGTVVVFEGLRSELFPPLPPDEASLYSLAVRAPGEPGDYILRLTLVQEFVVWLDRLGRFADIPCKVV